MKKKDVFVVLFILVLASFGIVRGVLQIKESVKKSRNQKFTSWMERCQEIRLEMSYNDVIRILGQPDSLSSSDGTGETLMLYKPPISHLPIETTPELVVSNFVVIFDEDGVTFFSIGYQ